MKAGTLLLRVEPFDSRTYVWVILEVDEHTHDVEVASSFALYDQPSTALRAGSDVFQSLWCDQRKTEAQRFDLWASQALAE